MLVVISYDKQSSLFLSTGLTHLDFEAKDGIFPSLRFGREPTVVEGICSRSFCSCLWIPFHLRPQTGIGNKHSREMMHCNGGQGVGPPLRSWG